MIRNNAWFLSEVFLVVIQCCIYPVKSTPKASFMNRVDTGDTTDADYDYYQTVYDSDVNIPGVHYPKLPYTKSIQRGFRLGYDDPRSNSLSRDVDKDFLEEDISPYFNRQMERNVTAQRGQIASLLCKVEQLGGKSVSWLRLEDLHVLTIGKYKYSTDKRIDINYERGSKEWRLVISPVHDSDQGLYECQISTKPILSFVVNLNVVDYYVPPPVENKFFIKLNDQTAKPKKLKTPVANSYIINAPDIYVYHGSLANLTCVVHHGTNSLEYILWYHKNEVITPIRGAVEVEIVRLDNGTTMSHLLIAKVQNRNEGAYRCKPSTDHIASAMLHVLHEELQAAMQANHSDSQCQNILNILLLLSILWATFS